MNIRTLCVSSICLLPALLPAQVPFVFEQIAADEFVAHRPGMQLRIDGGGAQFAFASGRSVAVELCGSAAIAAAEQPLPGRSHYLIGSDATRWRRDVPHVGRVRCRAAWPGIDVVWYARDGVLEYDLVIAPGADIGDAAIAFRGCDRLTLGDDGSVALDLGGERLVQRAPIAFQEVGGQRRPVAVSVHATGTSVTFALGEHDPRREVVIDPQIAYGTFLGGNSADAVHAIATDAAGNLYLTGLTASSNFPVVAPLQPAIRPLYDLFVTKLDPTGSTILWSTYLGGSSGGFGTDEWAVAMAVTPAGEAVVLGRTEATDFPTRNAFQPALAGNVDAVVFRLDAAGSQLLWSTYLGGTGDDVDRDNRIGGAGGGVVLDAAGSAFVAATTWSTDFPVRNASQPANAGGTDAFVAQFSAAGALLYSSYLGGSGFDEVLSAVPGEPGNALVTGSTTAAFPTTPGAYDRRGSGGFAVSVQMASQTRAWSTTFPSAITEAAVDAAGEVYFVGTVTGALPTTMGAHQVDHGGSFNGHGMQAFAAKLGVAAAQLTWATFYGSPSDNESFTAVAVDAFGHVYAAGTTSEHYGTPSQSAFVVKFNPQGSSVVYAMDVSGRNSSGHDLLLAGNGSVWVAGETWAASTTFATPGAAQTVHGGNVDGFLARVEDRAARVQALKFPVDRLATNDLRTGTVTLDGVAPAGGATIALTSSSTLVNVPASVLVPAGSTTALVPITTGRIAGTQQVTITATWNGSNGQATLRAWPGPFYAAVAIEVPGAPNGRSIAYGIDSFGAVVGTNELSAFRFHDSSGVQILGQGEARGIADDGTIAGGTGSQAFRWTPAGGMQLLGALQPGSFSIGYDADAHGRVVGFSDFFNGSVYGRRAFLWTPLSGMQNLGTLGGDASVAYAINRRGVVTGSTALATANEVPFLWASGSGMQSLGLLPGYSSGTGFDVNDANQVAGIMLGSNLRAFRRDPAVGLVDLGVLPGDSSSGARGINAFGWTVGWSSPSQANNGTAMRHVEGSMQRLTDELSAEDAFAWQLTSANGINDQGQITGSGDYRCAAHAETAFRLDPALQRPYGRGCPGLDGRVTALAGTGHPLPGSTIRWYVSGRPGAIAALVLGTSPASVPLPGGCELLLAGPTMTAPLFVLDTAGIAVLPVPLPATLAGTFFLQAVTLDAASSNGLFTTSNGLQIRIL